MIAAPLVATHLDERRSELITEPVIGATGRPNTHQRTPTRHLMPIFGEVEITRVSDGSHGTASLHHLDAALNLPPEHYSYGVRYRIAIEAAQHACDGTPGRFAKTAPLMHAICDELLPCLATTT